MKDGTKSTNSKPTLLEDQRKEHENIVMDEREAFYHATLIVKAFDFIVAASLSVTIMLVLMVMTAMQIHSRHGLTRDSEAATMKSKAFMINVKSVLCAQ